MRIRCVSGHTQSEQLVDLRELLLNVKKTGSIGIEIETFSNRPTLINRKKKLLVWSFRSAAVSFTADSFSFLTHTSKHTLKNITCNYTPLFMGSAKQHCSVAGLH